jgi:hypothetical protein
MIRLRTKIVAAAILAIFAGLLLASACYFFPNQVSEQMPAPKPLTSWSNQMLWATLWMSLALIISLVIVGVVMLTNKIRRNAISIGDSFGWCFDF